jgi:hypothetical protein
LFTVISSGYTVGPGTKEAIAKYLFFKKVKDIGCWGGKEERKEGGKEGREGGREGRKEGREIQFVYSPQVTTWILVSGQHGPLGPSASLS